jgi:small-conductance mechanosensitive channel
MKMLQKSILTVVALVMVALSSLCAAAQQMPGRENRETKPSAILLSGILEWEADARAGFRGLIVALPGLPAEVSAVAHRVEGEAEQNGFMPVAAILGLVLLASLSAEWMVRRFLHRLWREHQPARHGVIELLPVASFILIVASLYFSIDWPQLTGAVIFFYLAAAVLFRLFWTICAMARATGTLSPFMFGRALVAGGILLSALATGAVAKALSISPETGDNTSIMFSILLLAASLEVVWRHAVTSGIHILRRKVLQTAGLMALWLLWLLGLHLVFWIGLYAIALPILLPFVERLAKAYVALHWAADPDNSVPTVIAVRGLRALVIALAVLWLIGVWQYYPNGSSRLHTLLDAVILGLFRSVIVLLVADLGWSVAKVVINRKLASVAGGTQLSPEEVAHRARLRTLLPIFRNGLAALVLVVTALTVLAELGIEVGPLIAGAGIFGVAIGFGSQTLVKDIISGVFYLMDDAFRVGEYIQSGSYMGTVDSFSLRSVRLRHHRGPIFTVPFGELGAVQNMSRDWAIDKFVLRLNFDADIDKAKKLVKKIGAELLEDPELGPLIIETLKLKGVEQIGDFGIEVSFTFTAVPGNQAMIRRSAQAMIREAFLENGIGFAQPTVQVGAYDRPDAAAAAMAMTRQRAQAE